MYLKISFDELMDMPVYVRKFWIDKYVASSNATNKEPNSSVVNGANINTYAKLEQNKKKNVSK